MMRPPSAITANGTVHAAMLKPVVVGDGSRKLRVEARGDKAFRALLGEPRFRAAVGLDRKAGSIYERIMGLGGVWEQSLVPCEKPEIVVTFTRDRVVRLVLRTACEGARERGTYKGTWAVTPMAIELRLPKPWTVY